MQEDGEKLLFDNNINGILEMAEKIDWFSEVFEHKFSNLKDFSALTLFKQYVLIPGKSQNFQILDIDMSGFGTKDRDEMNRYNMLVTNERLNRRDIAIQSMLAGENQGKNME
jgi:hypothetical protein